MAKKTFENLTPEEIIRVRSLLLESKIKDISKEFSVCAATAYNWAKKLEISHSPAEALHPTVGMSLYERQINFIEKFMKSTNIRSKSEATRRLLDIGIRYAQEV